MDLINFNPKQIAANPGHGYVFAVTLLVLAATSASTSRRTFAAEPPAPGVAQEERLKDPKVIAELIKQLGDDKFEKREAATRELMKAGKEAIRPLHVAEKQGEKEQRFRAAKVLDVIQPVVVEAAANKLRAIGIDVKTSSPKRGFCTVAVKDVDLSNPDDFAPAADLYDIVSFTAENTNFSDDSLVFLTEMKNLRGFRIMKCQMSDAGMKHIGKLSGLKGIEFRETHVPGKGLSQLNELSHLEGLSFIDCELPDEQMTSLSELSSLKHIYFKNSNCGEETLRALSRLPAFVYLRAADCLISDEGMRHLASSPSINRILITGSKVTDLGIVPFAASKTLVKLGLEGSALTKYGVQRVSAAPRLEEIVCEVTDDFSLDDAKEICAAHPQLTLVGVQDGKKQLKTWGNPTSTDPKKP